MERSPINPQMTDTVEEMRKLLRELDPKKLQNYGRNRYQMLRTPAVLKADAENVKGDAARGDE